MNFTSSGYLRLMNIWYKYQRLIILPIPLNLDLDLDLDLDLGLALAACLDLYKEDHILMNRIY